jgi:hypothetical protein
VLRVILVASVLAVMKDLATDFQSH